MLAQLQQYVDACFTGLWIQTREPDEALAEIRRMAQENEWNLLAWDAASGLQGDGNGDPLAAVNALPTLGTGDTTGLIVFRNFHRFLQDIQTGKSAIAKAMGNEMGLPTLIADLGSLMGSLVGQTEERTRQLFALIRQLGRCVVMFDEAHCQFGGSRDRHEVTGWLIGAVQSFMQDQTGAFFVMTANEVASLPGPLMRAGRMDAVYFVDLPGEEQRETIWKIHLAKYGLNPCPPGWSPPDDFLPSCEGWSGAEIEHYCRSAAMYDLSLDDAAGFVVPVATSQAAEIEALRQEAAKNGWLSAEHPGPYTRAGQQKTKGRRQVSRPSSN